jgi:ribosomal protein L29
MTLEELYGLQADSHIDKKAGRPSEEDETKLKELREEYFKKFVKSTGTVKN